MWSLLLDLDRTVDANGRTSVGFGATDLQACDHRRRELDGSREATESLAIYVRPPSETSIEESQGSVGETGIGCLAQSTAHRRRNGASLQPLSR